MSAGCREAGICLFRRGEKTAVGCECSVFEDAQPSWGGGPYKNCTRLVDQYARSKFFLPVVHMAIFSVWPVKSGEGVPHL
jgi:hypothetical protein